MLPLGAFFDTLTLGRGFFTFSSPWGLLITTLQQVTNQGYNMQDEKVTIQVAAKALSVTPKTIHQWLRNGTLTRVKEGNRTYILMDEMRALRQERVTNPKSEVITSEAKIEQVTNQGDDIVPIKRAHYEGLLTRLGQLEANQQLLLEYKEGLQGKDKALEQAKENINAQAQELAEARATITKARNELQRLLEIKQNTEIKGRALMEQQAKIERKDKELAEIRTEVERLRLPWWKRLFLKK